MSVSQYVKSPVQVQAMQLTKPTDLEKAGEWIKDNGGQCSWVATTTQSEYTQTQDWLKVHTVEGVMSAFLGDWIVLGRTGGFWTMRDDVFRTTYRPMRDEEHGNN